jgi:hypothetical protein
MLNYNSSSITKIFITGTEEKSACFNLKRFYRKRQIKNYWQVNKAGSLMDKQILVIKSISERTLIHFYIFILCIRSV